MSLSLLKVENVYIETARAFVIVTAELTHCHSFICSATRGLIGVVQSCFYVHHVQSNNMTT